MTARPPSSYLLDPLVELGDVGVQAVDTAGHLGQPEPVMICELPSERARLATEEVALSFWSGFLLGTASPMHI